VILVDVNILLYATNTNSERHVAARTWLDDRLSGTTRVGLPWNSLLGFLRIVTNRQAYASALSMRNAWNQVKDWLSADPAWIPQPTERHAAILADLLAQPAVYGKLVSDAHLAALAIEHGLTLCSTDGDFARFRELKWLDPLSP
jgi:toxin-antitoxin system PIN domain toxin